MYVYYKCCYINLQYNPFIHKEELKTLKCELEMYYFAAYCANNNVWDLLATEKYIPDYNSIPVQQYEKLKKRLTTYGITFEGYGKNVMKMILASYLPIKYRLLNKNKFFKCKGCKVAVYCSRKCQKLDWNKYEHNWQCEQYRIFQGYVNN